MRANDFSPHDQVILCGGSSGEVVTQLVGILGSIGKDCAHVTISLVKDKLEVELEVGDDKVDFLIPLTIPFI